MDAATIDMQWDIPIGARVFTRDGRRLGEVTAADAYGLVVEDGFFFRRSYTIALADVEQYEDGALYLSLTMEQAMALEAGG